ncbi:MAG: aspartyl/asparaginyl beta-hydroxylase domain-containing protein [Chitinophagaceae bacterium]
MIKYLLLQQQFDVKKMQAEVRKLVDEAWKEHYNKKHYEGGWSILPLRSIGGSLDNTYSIHSSGNEKIIYKDTQLLADCNYLRSVLDFFQCEKTSVRLMKLNAGAIIKEHSDQEMSFEEGEVRFHIPVHTNDQVEFYIMDEKVPMKEGECWYLNLSQRHRVSNLGTTDRVHLVIDCKVNDWIKKIFSENALVRKEISDEELKPRYSPEEKLRIIQQLRLMNTDTGNELADKMETE